MRLTVVSPFLDRMHGTELCIIEQIERLAYQHKWEIHVYSQRVEGVKGLRPVFGSAEHSPGSIFWHKVPAIPGPHLVNYLWWFFANTWQRRRDRWLGRVHSDLVYSPGINCLDADVVVVHMVFHAFLQRVRVELDFRRVPLRRWPVLMHRKLYYGLIMFLERKIYREPALALIAVSSLVRAQMKSHFGRSDVTVINNAVDTVGLTKERRLAKRNESRDQFQCGKHEFVLLLIGNDWKKKGLDSLLRALDQLSDVPFRLFVVGSDNAGLYRTQVERSGLGDRIRFEQPRAEVLRCYAAADLYVAPSLEDGFNLPIVEAMACGLPVIASSQAGSSELIRDGKTGFILNDPKDDSQLARLIRCVFEDETLRLTMGEAASRYVLASCGWDQNVDETRKFLETAFECLSRQ